ncbi:MAG TPA: hypothetical protein G4N96_06555 [Chloroflexi bacterium]|nr:MAG: hypothetical protein B6243_10500 [Anaerolineaceae bacterium 4572_5.2]HEY84755.1 hypothetical protein [Chloroflexota bacterium]
MAKPIVDGLEKDLEGKAQVHRFDVLSRIGRQAAAHYGARGVPTLLVVDGNGQLVLSQVGIVRPGAVRDKVDELLAQ